MKIGYFSSYDRGLECLLKLWPEIKRQVPKAELHIYYGWNTFDAYRSKDAEAMRWKWQMIRLMKQDGVFEHGRVNHLELAKVMKQIKVWAYPTEFTEIHCITALKTAEASCIPVTTQCYALEETVADTTYSVPCTDIYSNNEKQVEFIDSVVRALKVKNYKPKQVKNAYWPDVAKIWSEALA